MHVLLIIAAGVTAGWITARQGRRHGPPRRPSPLRRSELDALLANEYGPVHRDADHDNRRVTLTAPVTLDDASWQQVIALVEHALDHALVRAGDDDGTYCAAGLRTEIAPAGRAIAWRLPAPVAPAAAHLLRLLPPEVAGWLRIDAPSHH